MGSQSSARIHSCKSSSAGACPRQYDGKEMTFHKRLLKLRNQQYARSDASTISVRPLKGSVVTDISSIRDIYFSPSELKLFLGMTARLSTRTHERLQEIRLSGS